MFRFSIREMMLVTLVVAFGVAWFAEHRKAQTALMDANRAQEQAKEAEETALARWHYWKDEVSFIEKQLPGYGLELGWPLHGKPIVRKTDNR